MFRSHGSRVNRVAITQSSAPNDPQSQIESAKARQQYSRDSHLSIEEKISLELRDRTLFETMSDHIAAWAPYELICMEADDTVKYHVGMPFGFIYGALFWSLLIYYTVTGIQDGLSQKYLSLEGSSNSANCTEVPQSVTAKFQADYNGFWEPKAEFQYSASVAQLTFTGSQISTETFTKTLNRFADKLGKLGKMSLTRPVVWTTMVWATYNFYDAPTGMSFSSNADAGIILSQPMLTAAWSSRRGLCKTSQSVNGNIISNITGRFDKSSYSFVLEIPLRHTIGVQDAADISDDEVYLETAISVEDEHVLPCPGQADLDVFYSFGYGTASTIQTMTIPFDVRTLNTVAALNMGILSLSSLIQTTSVYKALLPIPGTFWIDEFYAPMQPIFCLDKTDSSYAFNKKIIDGPEICYYAYGGYGAINPLLVYPGIGQLKTSNFSEDVSPTLATCKCPEDRDNVDCNAQIFVYSMFHLRYDIDNYDSIIKLGVRLQKHILDDPINGDIAMMDALINVTIHTRAQAKGFEMNDGRLRDAWDYLNPEQDMSVIIFESVGWSDWTIFNPINKYNVQLGSLANREYKMVKNGRTFSLPAQMCTDTLSLSKAMKMLAEQPPIPLVQTYYQCSNKLATIFPNAFGAAYGNAAVYTLIVLFVTGVSCVLTLNLCFPKRASNGTPVKRVLTSLEKREVQEIHQARISKKTVELYELIAEQHRNCSCGHKDGADVIQSKVEEIKELMDFDGVQEKADDEAVKLARIRRASSMVHANNKQLSGKDDHEGGV